jgi:lysophospholipase L1-like esterase
MRKDILRSTTVTLGSWMFFVGSLMFLAFVNYWPGQQASILLLCAGIVAVVAGLISQIVDKQSFTHLVRRIVDSPKTVALITLNTIIFFACLELAAAFVTKVWKEPVKMTDEDLPRAHTSYYASQAWAKQYWREFSLSRPQLYRHYVNWRRAPFKGQFININRDGIRLTPGANCSVNSYKVFAFGGSTLWGTGSPDWGTIPAYLQADFNALRHGPVCVVNFGETAFVSTQGVIELIMQLQSGNVPDLVVFYDGVNDVYAAYQSGRPTHQNFDQIAAKLENKESSPPLVAWIKSTNSFHLFNRLMAEWRQKPPNSQELVTYKTMGIDTSTLSDSVVETYLSNYEIVDALARKYGFKFFFFWQPVISIGDKPLTSEEQDMRRQMEPALIELHESVYRRVQRVANEYENLYYIAEMFDSLDSGIWIDYSHVTPVGNRLIAEKMFGVITGQPDAKQS